jgi:hypothetical protein
MTLITCEVIALIISLWHDHNNDIPKSVLYSANRNNNNMALLQSVLFSSESILPTIAATFFLLFSIYILSKNGQQRNNSWLFPAMLSLLFLLFSLKAIVSEGLLGFWAEHTRNLWGNQIAKSTFLMSIFSQLSKFAKLLKSSTFADRKQFFRIDFCILLERF